MCCQLPRHTSLVACLGICHVSAEYDVVEGPSRGGGPRSSAQAIEEVYCFGSALLVEYQHSGPGPTAATAASSASVCGRSTRGIVSDWILLALFLPIGALFHEPPPSHL